MLLLGLVYLGCLKLGLVYLGCLKLGLQIIISEFYKF